MLNLFKNRAPGFRIGMPIEDIAEAISLSLPAPAVPAVKPGWSALFERLCAPDIQGMSSADIAPYVDQVNDMPAEYRAELYPLVLRADLSDAQQLRLIAAANTLSGAMRVECLSALSEVFGRLGVAALKQIVVLAFDETDDQFRHDLVANVAFQIPEAGGLPGGGENLAQAAIGITDERLRYSALRALSNTARLCSSMCVTLFTEQDVTRMTGMLRLMSLRLTPRSKLLNPGPQQWF